MGIKHFRKWLGGIKQAQAKKLPPISSLFIDVNGMFYESVYKILGSNDEIKKLKPRDKEKELEKIYDNLVKLSDDEITFLVAEQFCKDLIELLQKLKPSENLILAVDGVAPMAKITQQRKRRYKEKEAPKGPKDPSSLFDTTCITPGTRFMQLMDGYIKQFINNSMKLRTNVFPPNIIYSSYLTPGEGEHKIFEHVRAGQINLENISANVVVGLDADLVMLTLLSDLPYLYLYNEKEDMKTGRKYDEIYNIDTLREYIHKDLNLIIPEYEWIDIKTTSRDFVVMVYMVGNDFLPNIIAFDDVQKSISNMVGVYQNLKLPLTNESGDLNWNNLQKFIAALAKKEIPLLEYTATKNFKYPFSILDKSVTKKHRETIEGSEEQLGPAVVAKLDMTKFQNLWYESGLEPKTEKGKNFMKKFKLEGVPFTQNGVLDMGYQYLYGLQWILHYYQNGTKACSSRFVYPYFYSPTLTDLSVILEYFIKIDKTPSVELVKTNISDPKINCIHQLIAVIPPKSFKFIPEPFRGLMLTRFADIAPMKYIIEKEGIDSDKLLYTALSILSVVDPLRIVRDIEDFDIPKEYYSQMPYFVKNVKKVTAPMKFLSFAALERYEQKQREQESEQIMSVKKSPEAPIDVMKSKIASIKSKIESIKSRDDYIENKKRNVLFWKKEPLM
jgi:5'-3' exoribonuclease 1